MNGRSSLHNLERRGNLAAAEEKYFELLTVPIEVYEEERFPFRAVSPVEVLAELIPVNNLKEKDSRRCSGRRASFPKFCIARSGP